MSNRNETKQLVKALNSIKATPFQVTAASTLLAVNGLQNALEFVDKCRELNAARVAKRLIDEEGDGLRLCSVCGQYECQSPATKCWRCREQEMIDDL